LGKELRFAKMQGIGATERLNSLPWVEKFRPKDLNDLVSHQDIISTIKRFMDQQKLPHLLFYGPAGTGNMTCRE
jgi:replication factor C subunit 3/5